MKEKVVLAYSGGLDTTVLIPWLKETYNYDVICVCIDVGQGNELDGLEERAKYCGASKLYIEHVVDEFCDEYIAPCVKANATYENKYLLGTAMARPLIAKILVDIAKKEGAVAICHGATGKGNDQVRFELDLLIPASQFICHPVDSGYISRAAVNVDQLFHLLQVQFQIHVSPPFRLQNLFQNSHLSSEIHYISYYNHLSICIIIYCIIIKFCVLCSFRIRKGNFVSIRADKCYNIILRLCGPKSDAGLPEGMLLTLGPQKIRFKSET